MPIRSLLKDNDSFDLEETILLDDAFENAVGDMAIAREDPVALIAATRIIEAARQGERDPGRVCNVAVKALQAGKAHACLAASNHQTLNHRRFLDSLLTLGPRIVARLVSKVAGIKDTDMGKS